MVYPWYDLKLGLLWYGLLGVGISFEVEESYFDYIILLYVMKHKMEKAEFIISYNKGKLKELLLDDFFCHDYVVKESGHNTL